MSSDKRNRSNKRSKKKSKNQSFAKKKKANPPQKPTYVNFFITQNFIKHETKAGNNSPGSTQNIIINSSGSEASNEINKEGENKAGSQNDKDPEPGKGKYITFAGSFILFVLICCSLAMTKLNGGAASICFIILLASLTIMCLSARAIWPNKETLYIVALFGLLALSVSFLNAQPESILNKINRYLEAKIGMGDTTLPAPKPDSLKTKSFHNSTTELTASDSVSHHSNSSKKKQQKKRKRHGQRTKIEESQQFSV